MFQSFVRWLRDEDSEDEVYNVLKQPSDKPRTAGEIRVAVCEARNRTRLPTGPVPDPANMPPIGFVERQLKKFKERGWLTIGETTKQFAEAVITEPTYTLNLSGNMRSRRPKPPVDDLGRPVSDVGGLNP